MGNVFDITPTRHKKTTEKSIATKPVKSPANIWVFLGLVVIIILVFTDISNSSGDKTKIALNNQNQTSNKPDVLGESTTDNQNNINSPDATINPNSVTLPANSNSNSDLSTNPKANESTNAIETKIDKSQIKIKILNGSGISGAATTAKNKLEGLGYKIESIGTAKNIYKQTTIYYNTGKKDFAIMVQLSLDNQSAKTLENPTLTANDDLLVVIGVK